MTGAEITLALTFLSSEHGLFSSRNHSGFMIPSSGGNTVPGKIEVVSALKETGMAVKLFPAKSIGISRSTIINTTAI